MERSAYLIPWALPFAFLRSWDWYYWSVGVQTLTCKWQESFTNRDRKGFGPLPQAARSRHNFKLSSSELMNMHTSSLTYLTYLPAPTPLFCTLKPKSLQHRYLMFCTPPPLPKTPLTSPTLPRPLSFLPPPLTTKSQKPLKRKTLQKSQSPPGIPSKASTAPLQHPPCNSANFTLSCAHSCTALET